MCKVIAIANQKGGVGKTAISANLSVGLVRKGKKVLAVDADPQGNLTTSMGIDNLDELEYTLASYMAGEIEGEQSELMKYILKTGEDVDMIPCNIQLAGMDYMIMNALNREHILESLVSAVREKYDYILIDCSPSLNLVTINALTCADSVLIPVEASYLSLKGLEQLLASIGAIKRKLNRKLEIEGIVINKLDRRTNHEKVIVESLRKSYGNNIKIFESVIPLGIRAKECAAHGISIFKFAPKDHVAMAFEELTKEVLGHGSEK